MIIKNIDVIRRVNCPVFPVVRNKFVTIVIKKTININLINLLFSLKIANKDIIAVNDKNWVYSIWEVKKGTGLDLFPLIEKPKNFSFISSKYIPYDINSFINIPPINEIIKYLMYSVFILVEIINIGNKKYLTKLS